MAYAGHDTLATMDNAGDDILATMAYAGHDILATVAYAGHDILATMAYAGHDILASIQPRRHADGAAVALPDSVFMALKRRLMHVIEVGWWAGVGRVDVRRLARNERRVGGGRGRGEGWGGGGEAEYTHTIVGWN